MSNTDLKRLQILTDIAVADAVWQLGRLTTIKHRARDNPAVKPLDFSDLRAIGEMPELAIVSHRRMLDFVQFHFLRRTVDKDNVLQNREFSSPLPTLRTP